MYVTIPWRPREKRKWEVLAMGIQERLEGNNTRFPLNPWACSGVV